VLVLMNGRLVSDVQREDLSGSLEDHFVRLAERTLREAA